MSKNTKETPEKEIDLELPEVRVLFDEVSANESELPEIPSELNILPLRDSVIYPMLIAPLNVSRDPSIRLVDEAIAAGHRLVGAVTQLDSHKDELTGEDVYATGCVVIIRTLVRMTDSVRLIVQGVARFKIVEMLQTEPYMRARIEVIEEPAVPEDKVEEVDALRRSISAIFDQAVKLSPNLPDDLRGLTDAVMQPNTMTDLVAAHMTMSVQDKQNVLQTADLIPRMRTLLQALGREIRVLELSSKVTSEVTQELSKSQREYLLREQLRAIQRELGESVDSTEELEELSAKIDAAGMSAEALKEVRREFDRLKRINPGSPEYTVARTYIDALVALPWQKATEDNLDLANVRQILDAEHAGLDPIKKRIIEFLAVRKMKQGVVRQPLLCFVGPPGVGKTSLGRSIATAMGRKFVRASLGGMRDEAEIRGHRRTYIGALPGQIIQGLRRSESRNPVFVLDEIDKLANDYRGDPSSALLEVLDPEQNAHFRDHYLDVPFDLSNVFFVATANRLDTIPAPLRDRMEVIELSGYTEEEKFQIAVRHLVPKQVEEHGLKKSQIALKPEAIRHVIRHYTREAGVRNLERELASVIRRATLLFAEGRTTKLSVTPKFVEDALGSPRFVHDEVNERVLMPGMAVGLAWTPVGGDILFIETALMPGKGLSVTGQLGDVMKESISAALGYIRSHTVLLGVDPEQLEKEIHVHVPAGATPKDGPSAGVTMLVALVSLLSSVAVKPRLAMTGEITLTGQILPVGGIKEKVLAAHRAGVTSLILPEANRKNYVEDVPEEIRELLTVVFVTQAQQALRAAFEPANLKKGSRKLP